MRRPRSDAHHGSAGEFADFFDSQWQAALRYAYVLTGRADEAEDVVAESFARVYRAFTRGHIDDPVAYLRRTIANHVRSGWRHREVQRAGDARIRVLAADATPAAETAIAARDAVRIVLESLPPRQRAVVALRYLEDRSEAETAEILGISLGTVKAHASRGLDRLREVLAAQGEGAR